jgi:hypothetical protein
MVQSVTQNNAHIARMGTLSLTVDNGQLLIRDGAYYCCLSGQETHRLMNLILDYRTDIIVLSVLEQREQEQKKREARGHKKPEYEVVNGKRVEVVNLEDEEDEA